MNLTTAQSAKYPGFIPPTIEELAGIEPGSFIQVSRRSRLFWVEVVDVTKEDIKGLVDSEDVSGLEYGEAITLTKGNVLCVFYT